MQYHFSLTIVDETGIFVTEENKPKLTSASVDMEKSPTVCESAAMEQLGGASKS